MSPLSAQVVKAKAKELGAHLVGIAAADTIREHPVPGCPNTPQDILKGARSVVVLARRLLWGMSREKEWNNRNVHYAGELALSKMEEISYELVHFLEGQGYPSIMIPAAYSRSYQVELAQKTLSLPHLAVEAGLGTLGLNLQLLTPEYGPRVILGAVVTQAELEPDPRLEKALCLGEECGRCLLACPGDAIGHWGLDLERCRPYSSPYGYHFLKRHVERILNSPPGEARYELMRSMDTFMIWQSMLRGVGIYTGDNRCADVCPVGADYQAHLKEVQEEIPESTPEKEERLRAMRRKRISGEVIQTMEEQRRWIGLLDFCGGPKYTG